MITSEYNSTGLDNANGTIGHPSDFGEPSLFDQLITSVYKQEGEAERTEIDGTLGAMLNTGEGAMSTVGNWADSLKGLTTVTSDLMSNVTSIWTNADTGETHLGTGATMGAKFDETTSQLDVWLQQARGLFNVAFPSDDNQTTKPIPDEGHTGPIGVETRTLEWAVYGLLIYLLWKAVA